MNLSPYNQFKAFKIGMGIYLFVNYAFFYYERVIFNPSMNFQLRLLPSYFPAALLTKSSHPEIWISSFLLLSMALSLGLCFLRFHKILGVLSFFCWNTILSAHPQLYLPQDGYIGWFLLALCFVPGKSESTVEWKMPKDLWRLAWLVTGLSYSISGQSKLMTLSWWDGEALGLILRGAPVRRGPVADLILSLPDPILQAFTWSVILFEFAGLPLSLFESGRKIYWWLLLFFHLGILITVNISSVTFAFLVLQLFLLDPDWLKEPLIKRNHKSSFFSILNKIGVK